METTKPRAQSRTWQATTELRPYGENWGTLTQTVTLTRTPAGLVAEVDGQPADLRRAVLILEGATRTEVLAVTLEPAPIGKARAAQLHRLMGRLGLPSAQHYALAAAALGEWTPLPSLAELTQGEARTVVKHLCDLYPSTRTVAA